jgi:hypothetical protein
VVQVVVLLLQAVLLELLDKVTMAVVAVVTQVAVVEVLVQ